MVALSEAHGWRDALYVFSACSGQRLVADGKSFTTGINACGRGTLWERSAQLFDKCRRSQVELNLITQSAAVTALGATSSQDTSQRWQLALALSCHAWNDTVSYTVAVTVLEKASRWQLALLRADRGISLSQPVASPTGIYNAAISACRSGSQWRLAVAWFKELGQPNLDAISCGATIGACGRGSRWKIAFTFLDHFQSWPELSTELNIKSKRHQVAYSASLAACEEGPWQSALELLKDLHENSLQIDLIACHSAITACGKGFRWQEAMQLPLSQRQGLASTTLNCVMTAYDRSSQWHRPLQLLTRMFGMNLQSNVISYNSAISGLAGDGCWKMATGLLRICTSGKLRLDAITFSGSMSACVRDGRWELALLFFQHLGHTMRKNVISSNAAISAYAAVQAAFWQAALLHLDTLHGPTMVSMNTAVSACSRVVKWNEPLVVLGHALSRRTEVDKVTGEAVQANFLYNSSIEASSATKQWRRAMLLLKQLTSFCDVSSLYHPLSLRAVISACAKSTQWSLALFLLDQAEQLDLLDDSVQTFNLLNLLDAYEAVLNGFSMAGAWQHSLLLLVRLRKRSLPVNALCHTAMVDVLEKSNRTALAPSFLAELQSLGWLVLKRS
eukprot:Skav203500  [mRNA]  locus=scaffold2089:114031:115881:- [translate_table: standard]